MTARALVGARFRLHGRDAATGLDCVGVVALALGIDDVPTGYPLRGGDPERWTAVLDARLRRVATWGAGDLLLMTTGPGQLHLGIWTGDALVHADVALGRVVERPGVPPWPVLGCWRRG
ncbi:peptidoglycan endopeptidase [Sphingomonas sp. 1P08PE]|uniref:peptidoglycan endopeptidase n=1 Tax=Sphingomonas sp. 1P08PE TaxID=554122 RepID=UPI00399F3A3B